MIRRLALGTLSACVVLLMFGRGSVAAEFPFFKLKNSSAEKAAIDDVAVGTAVQTVSAEVPATIARPANEMPYGADLHPVDPHPYVVEDFPSGGCPPEAIPQQGLFGWGRLAPHFNLPSRSFSLFQSPASYGWEHWERCRPRLWKPRGVGFPKRNSTYRMDYSPYVLRHAESTHGPAFYMQYDVYPCEECHLQKAHIREYYRGYW